jgi:hypothetical protein
LSTDTNKSAARPNNEGSDTLQKGLLFFIIIAFLIISTLYSFAVPIYEAQDEKAHFEFIRFIAKEARLPDFRNSKDAKAAGVESIQTPFYYIVQGTMLRMLGRSNIDFEFEKNPLRGKSMPAIYYHNKEGEGFPYQGKYRTFHLLRFTNIVAGILILLIIYKTALLILPAETCLPAAATGFVALIPQFTYVCAMISNDAFSILFASLALYFTLRFILSPSASPKLVALMSASIAFGVLSKQMALYLIPVCYVAVLVKGDFREKAKNVLAMTIILLLLAGWFYARNWLLFGDVLNLKTQMQEFSFLLVERKTLSQFFVVYFPVYFVPRFIKSFWGSFGYTTVWVGWTTYLFYNVIAGAGLISCILGMLDSSFRNGLSKEQKIGLALLLFAAAMLMAEIMSLNFSFSQPQGRYSFSCLVCLAIFWALGMERLVRGKQRHRNLFYLFLVLLFVSMNLHALGCVLNKAFSLPPRRIDVMQKKGRAHQLTLDKNTIVGQTFLCDIDNLDLVAVKFHTRAEYRNCQIVFRLKSTTKPQTNLARLVVPGNILQDRAYHFFRFPALKNSKGKAYVFLLEAVDERGFAGIDCYHTDDDVYKGGTAIENGHPLPVDLAFITGSS